MNTTHLKLTGIAAILAVVALGSVYLFARPPAPAPNASAISPSLAAVTAAVVAVTPAPALGATSTQPKITWSTTSVQVILSPGESTSSDLTFTSSLRLSNIVLEPATTVAPFVSIQPSKFASVPANQAQSIHIALSIPAGTTLGTYKGTIHLRSGSTTYPQTLKVAVNVWQTFSSTYYGIKLPPRVNVTSQTDASDVFFDKPGSTGYRLELRALSNNSGLSLEAWVINEWLQLPNSTANSTLSEYSRIQEGLATAERFTSPSGFTALKLLEHDEGDSLLTFFAVPSMASVYVLIGSGKDIDQNLDFANNLAEISLVGTTFNVK